MTTTIEFITALFCQVDDHLSTSPNTPRPTSGPVKSSLGLLTPSRRGQPALLSLADTRLSRPVPRLPERTRLFRCSRPSGLDAGVLGCSDRAEVIDTVGSSSSIRCGKGAARGRLAARLSNPAGCRRETLSAAQPVGVDRGVGVCHRQCCGQHLSMADSAGGWANDRPERHRFHAAGGDPSNLKLCQRGEWQDRMLVETVLSMLTLVCHLKKVMHQGWACFRRAWRSPWLPSMCWSSGTASSPARLA